MTLRCKVIRALGATELEAEINRFLAEELSPASAMQMEEITQSEGSEGITVVVWYSVLSDEDIDEMDAGQPEDAGDWA